MFSLENICIQVTLYRLRYIYHAYVCIYTYYTYSRNNNERKSGLGFVRHWPGRVYIEGIVREERKRPQWCNYVIISFFYNYKNEIKFIWIKQVLIQESKVSPSWNWFLKIFIQYNDHGSIEWFIYLSRDHKSSKILVIVEKLQRCMNCIYFKVISHSDITGSPTKCES